MKQIRLLFVLGLIALGLNAHSQTYSGKVVDDVGEPLVAATVRNLSSNTGELTNLDGQFTIAGNSGDRIQISYVGYETQTLTLGQASLTNIVMQNSQALEEVVVTAYNVQEKSSITGSVATVDIAKINQAPRASFQESLQGNAPGVLSTSGSGQPGSAPSITIRGIGSISISNQPLYVIDGIPVNSGDLSVINTSSNILAGLNPNDIESISVLKDASAATLYGSRAGNGVIIITTKKGKEGKSKVSFNAQSGFTKMTTLEASRPMSTPEFQEVMVEGVINAGRATNETDALAYLTTRGFNPEVNTDWVNLLARDGGYDQYDISLSGGGQKTTFRLSGGLFNQQGVFEGSDLKRYTGRLNLTHKLNDKLSANTNLSVGKQDLSTLPNSGAFANPVRSMWRVRSDYAPYNDDGTYNLSFNNTFNPLALAKENFKIGAIYNALAGAGVQYKFLDFLTYELKGNYEFNYLNEKEYWNPDFGDGRNTGGRGYSRLSNFDNYNITNLIRGTNQINENIQLNYFLGQEAQQSSRNRTYAEVTGYAPGGLTNLSLGSQYEEAASNSSKNRIASYFSNVESRIFDDRYVLSASLRRDASSKFGKDVRWGTFWSFGGAWNIAYEPFFNVDAINELKLRASYGKNGNNSLSDFQYKATYRASDYAGNSSITVGQLGNPLLTWEVNKPLDFGLDIALLKNRIVSTFDWYNRKTEDLLLSVPISGANGLNTAWKNIGSMENKGVEFSLSSKNIVNDDGFNWNTDFTISQNKNKVTGLNNDEPLNYGVQRVSVGKDIQTWYLKGYAGVDPDNGDALWYTDETETETTNNYGNAVPYDHGSATPKFFGSFNNTLSYQGFGFNANLFFSKGGYIYDTWGRYTQTDGASGLSSTGNMQRLIYLNRWQQPGDVTRFPKVVYGNRQSGSSSQSSTRFLYDRSYMRLRDVSFFYNTTPELASKLKMEGIRVYLRGNNLWTHIKDPYLPHDPETFLGGNVNQEIPQSKTLLFGIDLNF